MTTAANVKKSDGSHWYYTDGRPCYELPKKDGSGMKVPTLADARKLNLLPGVTTILKILHKEALVSWMIEQAVLAVITTPRIPGEADDAFIHRVLNTERVQDEESQKARDRGTEIHAAMESLFLGQSIAGDIAPWIEPAAKAIMDGGKTEGVETIMVGEGYAGKVDLIQDLGDRWCIWDFKSAKKLPDPKKGAWSEHRLQLSAYARAWHIRQKAAGKKIVTANAYISTVEPGKFVICNHGEEWPVTFHHGFEPLVKHWQWATDYHPAL